MLGEHRSRLNKDTETDIERIETPSEPRAIADAGSSLIPSRSHDWGRRKFPSSLQTWTS